MQTVGIPWETEEQMTHKIGEYNFRASTVSSQLSPTTTEVSSSLPQRTLGRNIYGSPSSGLDHSCSFGAQGRHLVAICTEHSFEHGFTQKGTSVSLPQVPLYLQAVQGSTFILLGSNQVEIDITKKIKVNTPF